MLLFFFLFSHLTLFYTYYPQQIVVQDSQILVRVETPDLIVAVQEQGLDLNADNLARLSNMNINNPTNQNAHTTAKEKAIKDKIFIRIPVCQ